MYAVDETLAVFWAWIISNSLVSDISMGGVGGGFNIQFQIYHSFLCARQHPIVSHTVNVVSEGLVVIWDLSVLVLSISVQKYLAVMYCVWWVLF